MRRKRCWTVCICLLLRRRMERSSGQGMVEVVNRQRKVPLDGERWREFAAKALKVAPANGAGVTVAFVSDRVMRGLNRGGGGRGGTTDVLSFPAGQDEVERAEGVTLGDVVVSVE